MTPEQKQQRISETVSNDQSVTTIEPEGDLHGPKALETISKLTREQLEAALAEIEKEEVNG